MMRKQYNRHVFLDSLERKYRKKIQLHAFKEENKELKRQLAAMRGQKVSRFERPRLDAYDLSIQ